MRSRLAEIVVGGTGEPLQRLGFAVGDDGRVALANGALQLTGSVASLIGLVIDGAPEVASDLEGIPLSAGSTRADDDHPNGAFELDHLVITTDSLERTSEAVHRVLGLEQRRVRETDTVRQAFHRFADPPGGVVRGCIVEIVESDRTRDRPTALMGMVVNVADLDRACADLGPDLIGAPKPAVQPGRHIATVRSTAGIGFPLALMTPP